MTIIVKVFQMMNEPTNSAIPAKAEKSSPTIENDFAKASEDSFATAAPVRASVPAGRTPAMRSVRAVSVTPPADRATISLKDPGAPSTRWAVAVSK